ncbi:MAG: iron ABC transporter permease [Pseudomonadota bacterium]
MTNASIPTRRKPERSAKASGALQSEGVASGLLARLRRLEAPAVLALIVAALLTLPVLSVAASIFSTDNGTLAHLAKTVLADYVINTIILVLGVGIGVAVLGVGTAWLVVMCAFPGRRLFEWALIMPLAIPAYIMAYAYTDLLSHPGLVQATLRDLTGWGPRDYWFPHVRSVGGAVAMFTLVLYPYVYLLARTAFQEQSTCYTEVSRTLGRSAAASFWQISLPLARPAIAGGVALALMETLADFGTVAHFGVQTFTTGIYRAWTSMFDLTAAGHLSTMLLGVVLLVVVLERLERRRARYVNTNRVRDLPRYELHGWRRLAAVIACLLPVVFGFILPVLVLINLHFVDGHDLLSSRYATLVLNSLIVASLAAVIVVGPALTLAYAARLSPGPVSALAGRMASLGYAVPGTVIAIGILWPLASVDWALDALFGLLFGINAGQLLTGTIAALIFAYCCRFMAVALNTVDAGFARIPGNLDAAARTLGQTRLGILQRVHLPLISTSLCTAALLVFVDVMKELPATLILRPFNFDTLAVQAYRLASDERLAQAATPSLVIVTVGLIAVLILSRQIMMTRGGARRG